MQLTEIYDSTIDKLDHISTITKRNLKMEKSQSNLSTNEIRKICLIWSIFECNLHEIYDCTMNKRWGTGFC